MESEKYILITQDDPSEPLQVEITGEWKAKEVSRIQRMLIISYRRHKAAIRKEARENKKEE